MRIIITAAHDPSLTTNRAKIIRARLNATRIMVERAADRGEVKDGTDPELAAELLAAPLNMRKLAGRPISDKFVKQVVEMLLGGIAK